MEMRTENNKLYRCLYLIVKNRAFDVLVATIIGLNTILLAMDKYPIDPNQEKVIEYLNALFTIFFLIEMSIKMLGLGFESYLREKENIFDMLIVIVSMADLGFCTYAHY